MYPLSSTNLGCVPFPLLGKSSKHVITCLFQLYPSNISHRSKEQKTVHRSRRVTVTPRLKFLLSALPVDILPEIGRDRFFNFSVENCPPKKKHIGQTNRCRIHSNKYSTRIENKEKQVKNCNCGTISLQKNMHVSKNHWSKSKRLIRKLSQWCYRLHGMQRHSTV